MACWVKPLLCTPWLLACLYTEALNVTAEFWQGKQSQLALRLGRVATLSAPLPRRAVAPRSTPLGWRSVLVPRRIWKRAVLLHANGTDGPGEDVLSAVEKAVRAAGGGAAVLARASGGWAGSCREAVQLSGGRPCLPAAGLPSQPA